MIAITFAPTSSPDHRVAALIANRWGMEHQTVDTDELERLSGDDAAALVRALLAVATSPATRSYSA